MTIYLYSGTPGSGKSYHATRDIYEKIVYKKNPVICNYDLSHDMKGYDELYHYKSNQDLDPDWLVEFSQEWFKTHRFRENEILLVVDECQLLFNSREWNNPKRMDWLQFFSQHRHYGYKVIFVAQSDKMVDRQFRALFEYETIHRKMANFGIAGRIISLLVLGRLFTAITTYYGLKERIGVKFFVLRKRIMRLYDSYDSFKRQAADEVRDTGRRKGGPRVTRRGGGGAAKAADAAA